MADLNLLGRGRWWAGSILTNPTDGTVLVDSGPITAGTYLVALVGTGSVAWVYDFQHRDAANAANNNAQRRRPAAGNEDFLAPNKVQVASGERFRAVLVGNVTGEVQMSVFALEQP